MSVDLNNETRMMETKLIYFVCTSNTCRSPMAEGLAKKYAQENGLPFEIRSFGHYVYSKTPSRHGVTLLAKRGIDISGHVPTSIDEVDLQDPRIIKIICMSGWHRDLVTDNAFVDPIARKVVVLSSTENVPDPIGGPIYEYEEVLEIIEAGVKTHLDQIYKNLQYFKGCRIFHLLLFLFIP